MTAWGDVIVRARGLSAHILSPARLAPLCRARDIDDLARQLNAFGVVIRDAGDAALDEHALELALRRRAGERFALLAKWAGSRMTELTPIFDDEDRRAIRTIVRGAIAHIDPHARTASLIPTPALPMRALDALAQAGDIATVASLLLAWGHPFGRVVEAEARRAQPDVLAFEVALVREFASRARAAAESGDAALRHFVTLTIDIANMRSALALAKWPSDIDPETLFVPGGETVTLSDMRNPDTAAKEPTRDALIADFRRLARDEPLGLAPVVLFALKQRAELEALIGIVWGVSLGLPEQALERLAGVAA